MIRKFPREIIDDATRLHGHLAPGLIIGFKLALLALKELRIDKDDTIMFTSETTRCIPDGVQAMCRYLLVNGGYHVYLRTYDIGKLAIQVSKNHEDLFRIILDNEYIKKNPTLNAWANMGGCETVEAKKLEDALWAIDIDKAFLKKPFKKMLEPGAVDKAIVTCPGCGEQTAKMTMVEKDGKLLCKSCIIFKK